MLYPINQLVSQFNGLNLEGDLVPPQWYSHLKNEKGKVQINAALILAHIVYWYRPVPIYDIKTGEFTRYGKKFKEDLLQLSYEDLELKFGLSRNQIRNALKFLENKQLIFREFRDIKVEKHALNNVMYIGIYPEKISAITENQTNDSSQVIITPFSLAIPSFSDQTVPRIETSLPPTPKPKEKDWSINFSLEQKAFLSHLLNLKPEMGEPIQKNDATWWIKSFGIEKIKVALEVYEQQVKKAQKDSSVPMPQSIGKYMRWALNNGIQSIHQDQSESISLISEEKPDSSPSLKNLQEVVSKTEAGLEENMKTNTEISMTSLSFSEVNDKESLTFQKNKLEEQAALEAKQISLVSIPIQDSIKTNSKNESLSLSKKEKDYLNYLSKLIPEKGPQIGLKTAISWIKKFGIEKIKTALCVYWQQIDKAKKNADEILPISIVEYLRTVLDQGLKPSDELQLKNKIFAEDFKNQLNWNELIIGDRDCRSRGQSWPYNLPNEMFKNALKDYYRYYVDINEALENLATFSLSAEIVNQFEEMSKVDSQQVTILINKTLDSSHISQETSDKIEILEKREEAIREKDPHQSTNSDILTKNLNSAKFIKDESFSNLSMSNAEFNKTQHTELKKYSLRQWQKRKNKEDWSFDFSTEQKEFLSYLINLKPERGEPIAQNTATYWIRHFGIEKIRIALQVYWQQVEKARKNPSIRMPDRLGAYVRKALNTGLKPCQEIDRHNRNFARSFKAANKWSDLTVTEKYCRMEGFGKELYYHLPQEVFKNCLIECFTNCCDYEGKFRHAI